MNVDRLPDGGDDDLEHAAGTPQPTESTRPEPSPPPEASQPKEDPQARQEPESTEKTVHADDSPKDSDVTTASPPDPAEARETAEPRSRQEHADLPDKTDLPNRTLGDQAPLEDNSPNHEHETGLESREHPSPANDRESPLEDPFDDQPSDPMSPESAEPDRETDHAPGAGPADDAFRPLTDQEYAEHANEVRDRLSEAHDKGLSTECQYTVDPDHLRWTRDRRQIHIEITETIYSRAADVPCDHKAIVAGGLGGAGKTTILREQSGVDLSQYLMINPDDIKEEMAKWKLVPEVEGLSPMEATDLVHEESSAIAKQLARRAYADGKNLIWDITMSSAESTEKRINDLREAGYTKVEGVFVDIPVDLSITRTQSRHRLDHNEFRAGRGLGGRFVPSEVIRSQVDQVWGSQNRKTFELLKYKFDAWTRYDNSVDGRRAFLVDHMMREGLRQHEEKEI